VILQAHRLYAGFAEHQLFFGLPEIFNPQNPTLIFVEFVDHALAQMDTHQAADIAGAEPGLVFKGKGVEREVVAGE
jgi:hypothetical protein